MSKIDEVYQALENEGLQLMAGTHLENDNGRDILILCNDDAETSDDYFMFECYSVSEMLEYLKKENLTEIA